MKYPKNSILKLAVICLVSSLIFSCGNNDKKENQTVIKETVKTVKTVKKAPKSNDFRAHLKATQPATETQLKNWMPAALGNLKRAEFTKSRISQNDIASAGAIYTNGDKKIKLTIEDGASKDGLLAINSHYMAQNLKLDNTKASGHEKTYQRNDLKVMETYVKKDGFYRVLFLYNMRFGITLESHGLTHDELWQAIESMALGKLQEL